MTANPKQVLEKALLNAKDILAAAYRAYPISRPFEVLDAVLYDHNLTSNALGLDVFTNPAESRYYVTYGDWTLEMIDRDDLLEVVQEALGPLTELSDESESVPNRDSGFAQVRKSAVDLEDASTRDAIQQGRREFTYVSDAQHWIASLGFVPVISDSLIDVEGARYSYAGVIWGDDTTDDVSAQVFPTHAIPREDIESGRAKIFGARTSVKNIGLQMKAGTSEGADKGWRTRRGYGIDETIKADKRREPLTAVYNEARQAQDEKLSQKERNAILDYTSLIYKPVNHYLRTGSTDMPGMTINAPGVMSIVETIDGIYARGVSQVAKTHTVYRGMSLSKGLLGKLKVGSTFVDKGFVSTSSDKEVAELFTGLQGSTFAQIKIPSGQSVLIGSVGERETILPRGLRFKVTSIAETRDGVKVLKLEIVK